MNERIRELAEQARKYARDYVTECKHYGHYMEHNEYELRFEEKFAELMVNEFDRVLLSYWIDSIGNRDKKTAKYIDYIRIRMKIYFGVEE